MLVLIRNIEEMDTALEAANKYVIIMQKLFDSNQLIFPGISGQLVKPSQTRFGVSTNTPRVGNLT